MGREEQLDVRILRQLLQHQFHTDACPPNHRSSSQDPGVGNNSFVSPGNNRNFLQL